jgi:hypothetical protein
MRQQLVLVISSIASLHAGPDLFLNLLLLLSALRCHCQWPCAMP